MLTLRTTPTVIRPQHEFGVDHGAKPIVLARAGTKEVWWQPGSKYWSAIGMPQAYSPCQLLLVDTRNGPYDALAHHELASGLRLSARLIRKFAQRIDRWLGVLPPQSAALLINVHKRHTVEVVHGD